jgi:hypothetical protein
MNQKNKLSSLDIAKLTILIGVITTQIVLYYALKGAKYLIESRSK